jgi:hypothetical protein
MEAPVPRSKREKAADKAEDVLGDTTTKGKK